MDFLKFLAILGFACLFVLGCSEKNPATTGQAGQPGSNNSSTVTGKIERHKAPAPSQMAGSASTEPTEIGGKVQQTEKGLALTTDSATYMISGKDLTDLVGKSVKVTGVLAAADGGQIIQVTSVKTMD
jgi:hypothetical protein